MAKSYTVRQKRFELVDECLRKDGHPMNIQQIREYCNKELNEEFTEETYRNDLKHIDENLGVKINKDKVRDGFHCFKYQDPGSSIIKGNSAANQVVLCNLNRIKKGLADFLGLDSDSTLTTITDELNKFLGYDENDGTGIEYEKILLKSHGKVKPRKLLEPLLKAIIQHQTLDIKYEVPGRDKREWTIFPQFLKQYNQRWYLIATKHRDEVEGKLYNLALDRILKMEDNQHIHYKECGIDFRVYFENVVGVTKPDGAEPIKVKLRIDRGEYPYIESKPIHVSQKVISEDGENKDYVYVSLYVYDNFELRSKILSYGSKVTVMEPMSLRDKLAHDLKKSLGNYKKKPHE